jgi:hypothetical protein
VVPQSERATARVGEPWRPNPSRPTKPQLTFAGTSAATEHSRNRAATQ